MLDGQELEPRTCAQTPIGVNFLGATALDRAGLSGCKQRWIAGASLRLVVPTGDYESDGLSNPGSSRWTLKPEVGFSRAVKKWTFEGAARHEIE